MPMREYVWLYADTDDNDFQVFTTQKAAREYAQEHRGDPLEDGTWEYVTIKKCKIKE